MSKKKNDSNLIDDEIKEVKREWRNLIKFKNDNQIIYIAILIVLVSLVTITSILYYKQPASIVNQNYHEQYGSKIVTSLMTADNDAFSAKVSNVSETNKPDFAFAILPSETMLIMDIEITNNTSKAQHLIPVSQFFVRSEEGDHSELHPSSLVKNPLAATDLEPGESAKGQISFAVPKHIATPILYIDPAWGGFAPLAIDVLH